MVNTNDSNSTPTKPNNSCENLSAIAVKNDQIRKTFTCCKLVFTPSVAARNDLDMIVNAIREFNQFTLENDPHGEHDFGKVIVNGGSYFWKFDYYDENFEFFKEDGNRVLKIMHVSEY